MTVTVTQQDSDAAVAAGHLVGRYTANEIAQVLNGKLDSDPFVQAFARHREEARANAEREIAEWVRKLNPYTSPSWIARQIERGAYRHG